MGKTSWCDTINDCLEYTYDKCDFNKDDQQHLIEVLNNSPSIDQCQFFCRSIYSDKCAGFIYEKGQAKCKLYSQAFNPFENCLISGGPDTVSSEICQNQKCRDFTELTCNYKGNILKTYPKIMYPNECYQLCEKSRHCKYFLQSGHTMTCQLLDSKERYCDRLVGPKS